jgi:hypothetical protein
MLKVVHSQVIKVLLSHKNFKTTIVRLEESEAFFSVINSMTRPSLNNGIGLFQLLQTMIYSSSALQLEGLVVSLGKLPPEFGSQGAFDVDMEFDFGKVKDELVVCVEKLLA